MQVKRWLHRLRRLRGLSAVGAAGRAGCLSGVLSMSVLLVSPGPSALAAEAIICAQASHRIEKLICADGLLMQLDATLNMNYRRMLYSPLDNSARAYLRRSQRDWVKVRNQCADAACVQRLYEHRVDEVCDYPVPTGVHAICDSAQSVIDNWRAQAARGRE